jgi:hypothetical protein
VEWRDVAMQNAGSSIQKRCEGGESGDLVGGFVTAISEFGEQLVRLETNKVLNSS